MSRRGVEEEEEVYTYSEIIAGIRDKLLGYFRLLADKLVVLERGIEEVKLEEYGVGSLETSGGRGLEGFRRIGVVDGGSNVISLNIGYIGVVSAIGIVLKDNRVVERMVSEPTIIPRDPDELELYESTSMIGSVVDKVREAMVFETACKLLDRDLDLLVIDGPLIPYGALAKIVTRSGGEREALRRYHDAVLELQRMSLNHDTSIIGFVKRPRSRYIALRLGLKGFDHVVLSRMLKPGQYYPEPPLEVYRYLEVFHEPGIRDIVEKIKPRTLYLRLTDSSPPYRIDMGRLIHDYRDIIQYLYNTRTREGIPYIIMKADEEAKITRRLIRELYEDVLHDYIINYIRRSPELLIPLLPEYGGI